MTDLPPLRALSLEGGGTRGAYSATYLKSVATAFATRRGVMALDIGKAFNLIVGTSTGGIIGCALAAGVDLDEVISLYRDHAPEIFRRSLPSIPGLLSDLANRPADLKAGTVALRSALEGVLKGVTVGQLYAERGIALAIPAVEMSQHRAWVFKTPHLPYSNHRDDNYSLVDVCLATTAAPIFRSMAAVTHPDSTDDTLFNVFVDGGLWANNPVLVALVDALDMAMPGQPIEIYSLGTCPIPAGEQIARGEVDRGLPGWKFGGAAASLSIDAQHFAFDHMAKKLSRHLDRRCTVVRFPSDKVPAALLPYLALDDTRPKAFEALVNQARTDADMTNSKCTYRDTDQEAALICSLFESAPALATPPQEQGANVAPNELKQQKG